MNLIHIACIILFLTYSSIIGILVYYFIWNRDIWNKTFHNEWLYDNEEENKKNNDIYQLELLGNVYNLLKPLVDLPKINKMLIILEYIIRNYNICKNARIELLDLLMDISLRQEFESKNEYKMQLEDILLIESHNDTIHKLMIYLLKLDINKMTSSLLVAFIIQLQKIILNISHIT